jgi:hypothetical protein
MLKDEDMRDPERHAEVTENHKNRKNHMNQ